MFMLVFFIIVVLECFGLVFQIYEGEQYGVFFASQTELTEVSVSNTVV